MPLFGELPDPAVVARLSAEAKQAGWHPDATLTPMTRVHVWRIDEGGQPR